VDPLTRSLLTRTVLDESADRGDRRYSLDRLLADGAASEAAISAVADECHDPFFRELAEAWVENRRIAREAGTAPDLRVRESLGKG